MARELLALRRHQSGYGLGFRCNRHIACAFDSSRPRASQSGSLADEIAERRLAEEALHRAKTELEFRVEERTGELKKANQVLLGEIAQRQKTEEELRHSEGRFRLLVESVQDYAIFMLDPSGRVLPVGMQVQRKSRDTKQRRLSDNTSRFSIRRKILIVRQRRWTSTRRRHRANSKMRDGGYARMVHASGPMR